jgi:hypothetical protein
MGHFLRRKCLPKRVIKGKIIESLVVMEIRQGRRKQLLDESTETRGY